MDATHGRAPSGRLGSLPVGWNGTGRDPRVVPGARPAGRTLAERLRAGGAGSPGSCTPAGTGGSVAEGGMTWRQRPDGTTAAASPSR
ncbi:MAG: hypothetical protein H5T76_30105 [Streptomyces sp.]|nr:hypothetical protein [Streptomyces sp.]